MRGIRFICVLALIGAIAIFFSPDDMAWDWFMADRPQPTNLGGLILYRDEWHSALFKTRLIAVGLFIGASFVGAWAHAQVELGGSPRSYYA
jgi:hypothetical protein